MIEEQKPKHAGGRPLLFKTPEDLKSAIDSYFSKTELKEWTVTGLALALETSRETLQNYKDRPEFFDLVKRAVDMVEHSYELDVKREGKAGGIFVLKNFGWSDHSTVDSRTTLTLPTPILPLPKP